MAKAFFEMCSLLSPEKSTPSSRDEVDDEVVVLLRERHLNRAGGLDADGARQFERREEAIGHVAEVPLVLREVGLEDGRGHVDDLAAAHAVVGDGGVVGRVAGGAELAVAEEEELLGAGLDEGLDERGEGAGVGGGYLAEGARDEERRAADVLGHGGVEREVAVGVGGGARVVHAGETGERGRQRGSRITLREEHAAAVADVGIEERERGWA